MTRFYVKWEVNRMYTPADSAERVKRWFYLLEAVRADVRSGAFPTGDCATMPVEAIVWLKLMK